MWGLGAGPVTGEDSCSGMVAGGGERIQGLNGKRGAIKAGPEVEVALPDSEFMGSECICSLVLGDNSKSLG